MVSLFAAGRRGKRAPRSVLGDAIWSNLLEVHTDDVSVEAELVDTGAYDVRFMAQLATVLRSGGSERLIFPSKRDSDGVCVGLFYPDLASPPVQGHHLDYHWDGARVDLVRDAGTGEVFRLKEC